MIGRPLALNVAQYNKTLDRAKERRKVEKSAIDSYFNNAVMCHCGLSIWIERAIYFFCLKCNKIYPKLSSMARYKKSVELKGSTHVIVNTQNHVCEMSLAKHFRLRELEK